MAGAGGVRYKLHRSTTPSTEYTAKSADGQQVLSDEKQLDRGRTYAMPLVNRRRFEEH